MIKNKSQKLAATQEKFKMLQFPRDIFLFLYSVL